MTNDDPFEAQLRKLPWQKAPKGLQGRLFPSQEEAPISFQGRVARHRVPLALAAGLVILIGMISLFLDHPSNTSATIVVEITMAERARENFFDLSSASPDFWPPAVELEILP